ncbi:mid1-interacting protein 1-B-like [Liolophura sinensis]|uniref:mid1-interacting protein 1-B-like n=1 Tax=Liolophura sinensis TaxID=3198878 RepID=UPI00315845DD
MGSDYGSGSMSLRLRDGDRVGGQQSIIKALNSFVKAVNVMDQTVMIPSRLRDMDVTVNLKSDGMKIPVENNNELAILPAGGSQHANLYGFYTMLHAIKHELVSGGRIDDSEDGAHEGGVGGLGEDSGESVDSEDSDSRPTAAAFRHHLTSLLGMLRQMTATANYLTTRYEHDLGQGPQQYSTWAI